MATRKPFSYTNLLSILNQAKIKSSDPAVYETIKQLLQNLDTNQNLIQDQITVNTNGLDQEILTADNATGVLPNSRKLIAGTGLTMDLSIGGEATLNDVDTPGGSGNGTGAIFIRDNECESDFGFSIPGPQGATGATGASGTPGGILTILGVDGQDGQDSLIPGPQGNTGATGAPGGDFTKIAEQTPTGTGTVTFSSLGSFTHLLVVWSGRGTQAATFTTFDMRINGDSSSIYDRQRMSGNATTSTVTESLTQNVINQIGVVAAANATAGMCGAGEVMIYDYRGTSLWKRVTGTFGFQSDTASAGLTVTTMTGDYRSTSAITSISFILQSGNWATGTKFSLYGFN